MILPCAHAFGEAKRIMSLMSIGISICQNLNIHRPHQQSETDVTSDALILREIQKRTWAFLYIQDSYLISFKKAHSISDLHAILDYL